jgi:hypothetical protein
MLKLFVVTVALSSLTFVSTDVFAAGRGGSGGGFSGGTGPTFQSGNPPGFSEGRKAGFDQGVPRGWDEGKKKGWDCKPGSPGCEPPGLKRK